MAVVENRWGLELPWAAGPEPFIIYDGTPGNHVSGALSFDADGSGAGAAIVFAVLSAGLPLGASDFVVI